jgi:hypothetical protein
MLPAPGYSPRRCVGQIPELTARRRGLEQAASCRLVPSSRYWPTIAGRTITSPPLCHRLFTASMCCRFGRDAGARSSTAMPHAAPLLPPSLLTPCAACLASSSLAPRARRHHALAHPCAPRGPVQRHPLASSPKPTAYGQTHSVSHPRKVTAAPCCPHEHARSTAASSRHLPLSLSLHRPALPPCNARL